MLPKDQYIFYYGTAVPDVACTRELQNKSIVLQNYHPLVHTRQYALFFPNLTRFVYWNMSRIHQSEYAAAQQTMNLPIIGKDAQWNTVILDLNHRICVDFVIQKALKILSDPQVDGLFVDDLDTWVEQPEQIDLGVSCLREIAQRSRQPVKWILNRGFSYWHQIDNLKAVILESITPGSIYKAQNDPHAKAWLENMYQLYVKPFKVVSPQTHVVGLTYDKDDWDKSEQEFPESISPLCRAFQSAFDDVIYLPYLVNEWPEHFLKTQK